MHEKYTQGNLNMNYMMLSNLVSALQQFAKEYGEEETRVIKIQGNMIYSIKDPITNYMYCLICEPETKQKELFKKLKEIMNLHIESFIGTSVISEAKRLEILHTFKDKLDEILAQKKKFHDFLKSM